MPGRRLYGHVYGTSASGGMAYHPILKKWVHNPYHVASRAVAGAGMAGAIGAGNYMTRNYRQKPLNRLYKYEHVKYRKSNTVKYPSTTGRRVKSYHRYRRYIPQDDRKKRRKKYWH